MIPVEDAEAHVTASVRGIQPELTGITKSLEMAILKIDAKNIFLSLEIDLDFEGSTLKIATRSRSNVFATAVKGHTMGTERMVVPTIAQSENLSSASCSKFQNRLWDYVGLCGIMWDNVG